MKGADSNESLSIRVVVIDNAPMFSARDVALALGYANPAEAYKTHAKLLKKLSYSELLELNWVNPNPQGEYVMPESDVYRMIVKSEKPEAERFEKWVFEDVLPTIRQTGGYALPKAHPAPVADAVLLKHRQAKAIASTYMCVAKLFGTDAPMARAIAADAVKQQTGIDFQRLLAGNVIEEKPLTPTELGKLRNWTARGTNLQLALAGFQARNPEGEWLPTEKGKAYCTCNPYKAPHSQHTGYRVLWYRTVLGLLPISSNEEVA